MPSFRWSRHRKFTHSAGQNPTGPFFLCCLNMPFLCIYLTGGNIFGATFRHPPSCPEKVSWPRSAISRTETGTGCSHGRCSGEEPGSGAWQPACYVRGRKMNGRAGTLTASPKDTPPVLKGCRKPCLPSAGLTKNSSVGKGGNRMNWSMPPDLPGRSSWEPFPGFHSTRG